MTVRFWWVRIRDTSCSPSARSRAASSSSGAAERLEPGFRRQRDRSLRPGSTTGSAREGEAVGGEKRAALPPPVL